MKYVFVLGASDPEMATIESICKGSGHATVYACSRGRRVHAGNAYNADSIGLCNYPGHIPVWVECRSNDYRSGHLVIDHHREGDPGYGYPPEEYWKGSSIGQLCHLLGHERTDQLSIIAAADHCLAHAYRGRCPGVTPEALRKWRASSRAAFQKISIKQIEDDVKLAVSTLSQRPLMELGGEVFIDAQGVELKEFAEASAILGESVLYKIYDRKSRRMKVGVLGGSSKKISAWMDWARIELVDCYGDPERGYAGGYCS